MAYQVLARKYRPQRFADVAGQDHVTVTLMNALTQDRIAHGYIFSGHRGIGKTTIARILACALNCRNAIGSELRPTPEPCEVCDSCLEIRAGSSVDVIEIDAATNRGIDEIRELRDAARYRPSRDRFKIYILDEAHQITDAAFNALLKTLEEPPDHIVFMMATTQPEDIPQTVRSRCQHFSFHAVKLADILNELRGIARHEGVEADESALSLLAEAGDGSMRDALSIMDQAIASAPLIDGKARLDAAQIRELMGTVANAVFERLMEAVGENRSAEVMTIANELLDAGNSPAQLARQAVRYLRSCVLAKITGLKPDSGQTELLQISPEEQRRAARTAALFTEEELTRFLQTMLRTFDELGYRQEQRFHFELGLLKLVHLRRLLPVEELLSRLGGGAQRPGPVTPPRPASAPEPAPVVSKPAFSPFEQNTQRRSKYDNIQSHTSLAADEKAQVAETSAAPKAKIPAAPPAPERAKAVPAKAVAVEQPPPESVMQVSPAPTIVSPAEKQQEPIAIPERIAPAPETSEDAAQPHASGQSPESVAVQKAVVEALIAGGQGAAADAVEDATITLAVGEATLQTQLSKTMLPVHINADAERIAKLALRVFDITKLVLLPGVRLQQEAGKRRTGKPGSAAAKAAEHPLVQRGRELFNAEIQTVFDLSESK